MHDQSITPVVLCACGCGESISPKAARNQGTRFIRHHHTRVMSRKGIPLRPLAERFWEKVDKSGECWLWTANRHGQGYGRFMVESTRRKSEPAHRVSWELTYGPIPEGMLVCHRCDNPPCVRPDHLFLGTDKDNSVDMFKKGRDSVVGVKAHHARFTEDQIRDIRKQAAAKVPYRRIGDQYGVDRDYIYKIVHRYLWKCVP